MTAATTRKVSIPPPNSRKLSYPIWDSFILFRSYFSFWNIFILKVQFVDQGRLTGHPTAANEQTSIETG